MPARLRLRRTTITKPSRGHDLGKESFVGVEHVGPLIVRLYIAAARLAHRPPEFGVAPQHVDRGFELGVSGVRQPASAAPGLPDEYVAPALHEGRSLLHPRFTKD